jgi:hypothetical protein
MSAQRTDWSAVPMVFVEAVTCPRCGSTRYETTRSLDNGDDSRTKLARCRGCRQPFKVVSEIPESGNIVWPPGYFGVVDITESEVQP